MTISIKDLVQEMSRELKNILDTSQEIVNDKNDLIYLSSEFNLEDLYVLLTKHKHNEAVVTEDNLQDFKNFTDKMWKSAKNTAKIFHLQTKTHINQFCLKLATRMADLVIDKYVNDRVNKVNEKTYQFLIPTLKRYDFGPVKNMHHYIMSDNNETMIHVYECLQEYETRSAMDKNRRLRYTHPVSDQEYLSESELQRVLNYSEKLRAYYDVLMQDEVDETIGTKRAAAKAILQNSKTIIGYSYDHKSKEGEEKIGWQKLYHQLYGNIFTFDSYLRRLHCLGEISWEYFSANLTKKISEKYACTIITLEDFLTNNNKIPLSTAMTNNKLYIKDDEKHNRAVLFAFFFCYWQQRKEAPNHTGGLWGFDRETKCNAARLILEFLLSKEPLSKFNDFLNGPNCRAYVGAMIKGYTNCWEMLVLLVEQMKKVCANKIEYLPDNRSAMKLIK